MKNKILTIGIQGGRGSFNEEALLTNSADLPNYEIKYLYTSGRVFKALEKGEIDLGQFAIFNSLGGMVEESIYASANFKYKIRAKYSINIKHYLLASPESDLNDIKVIMSHPQCFAQCKNTLAKRYPNLKKIVGKGKYIDPAYAGKMLIQQKLPSSVAIIGNKTIATIHNLKILGENLQDSNDNFTTFLLVAKTKSKFRQVII